MINTRTKTTTTTMTVADTAHIRDVCALKPLDDDALLDYDNDDADLLEDAASQDPFSGPAPYSSPYSPFTYSPSAFFDFEGDPLWTAPSGEMEGLEYLWGWVEAPGGDTAGTAFGDFRFTGLWADTRGEERAALEEFVRFVEARRARHPGMRVYHYAPYEVTALKRLTVRHGMGERELDDWLHYYNHHRPHTACGNLPPFSRLINVSGQYT